MKNTYIIGDIHGGHRALLQCIERSGIDREGDRLICLGDVADGWTQTKECFDELLTFKNLVYVIGNHDAWLLDYWETSNKPSAWVNQGGRNTLRSYNNLCVPAHHDLLKKSLDYFVDEDNNLFLHGGYNWHHDIDDPIHYREYRTMSGLRHSQYNWDRHMWEIAVWHDALLKARPDKYNFDDLKIKDYNTVFIGHTSTSYNNPDLKPVQAMNVWNLDQGGGWEGKLTIMNVKTSQYWQSDIVKTLYPNEKGR